MSVNKHRPHVLVLPEDDANRQLANGFLLDQLMAPRRMQVLEEVGGWRRVMDSFKQDHIPEMDRNQNRFVVLLIDFDRQQDRLTEVRAEIPDHLAVRVFILGAWSEPEELRRERGESFEAIGLAMARDCRENTEAVWSHPLLRHNATELVRLREQIRPILFPG